MKKAFSRHSILVLFAIASLAASASAYYFIDRAAVGRAVSAADASAAAQDAARLSRAAADTQKEYDQTAASRALLPSLVVSKGSVVSFIKAIEAVGRDSGASVSISSISSASASDGAQPLIKGTVAVAGSWSQAMRAVRMVEDLPYALSVTGLRLAASDKAWTASMDIAVLSSAQQ